MTPISQPGSVGPGSEPKEPMAAPASVPDADGSIRWPLSRPSLDYHLPDRSAWAWSGSLYDMPASS